MTGIFCIHIMISYPYGSALSAEDHCTYKTKHSAAKQLRDIPMKIIISCGHYSYDLDTLEGKLVYAISQESNNIYGYPIEMDDTVLVQDGGIRHKIAFHGALARMEEALIQKLPQGIYSVKEQLELITLMMRKVLSTNNYTIPVLTISEEIYLLQLLRKQPVKVEAIKLTVNIDRNTY